MKPIPFLAAAGAALIVVAGCAAHADSSVVMMLDTGAINTATGNPTAVKHTPDLFGTGDHAGDERQDMSIYSPAPLHLVAILQCDKGVYITLDPARRLYSSEPMSEAPVSLFGINSFQYLLSPAGRNPALKTGAIAVQVAVKDLGITTPPGMKDRAHEYSIDSHEVSSGAAGTAETDTHATVWTSLTLHRISCPDLYKPKRIILTPSGARITYTVTGDAARYEALSEFLPVMVRLAAGGHMLIFRDENASAAPLPATAFAVPSGFKRVSLAELSRIEAQASGPAAPAPLSLSPTS